MARPRKNLTPEQVEQVEKLAAVLTQEQIADFLGISDRTLRRRFHDAPAVLAAYAQGRARAVAGVATTLLQEAKDKKPWAVQFYLETQGGWSKLRRTELSGPDGGPIQSEARVTVYIPENGRDG